MIPVKTLELTIRYNNSKLLNFRLKRVNKR